MMRSTNKMCRNALAIVALLIACAAGARADIFTCGVTWRVGGQVLQRVAGTPTACQTLCEKNRACQFFYVTEDANAPQAMVCYVMGTPGGDKRRDDDVQLICARDAVWPALAVPTNLVGSKGTFIPGRGAGAKTGTYRRAAKSTGVIAIHATQIPNTESLVFFGRPQDPKYPPQPFMEIDKTGVEWPSAILDTRTGKYAPVPWNMGAPFCAHQIHTVNGDILVCGGDDDFVGQPGNGAWGGAKGCRYMTKNARGQYVWYKFGDLSGGHWYPSIVELPPRVSGSKGTCGLVIGGLAKAPYPKYDLTDRVDVACLQMGVTFGSSVYDAGSTPQVAASLRQMYPVTFLLPVGDVPAKPVLVLFGELAGDVVTVDLDFTGYKLSVTSIKALPPAPEEKFTFTAPSSSTLKPIDLTKTKDPGAVEVLIFGGAYYPDGPFVANGKVFRIKPLVDNPQWEVEAMPTTAVMREAINLPNGKVLLINGARLGKAGGGRVCCSSMAGGPILQVWIYNPDAPAGRRWWVDTTLSPHFRLYHSVAWLGRDGQIWITGGDQAPIPNNRPGFAVDAYIPPGLTRAIATKTRPVIRAAPGRFRYGAKLTVRMAGGYASRCSLSKPVATTHATGSSQRMIMLKTAQNAMDRKNIRRGGFLVVEAPTSAYVAPPGWYLLYCWHGDVWTTATWTYLMEK